MDIEVFNKVLFFWFIFFITPGPVWLPVMAVTAKKSWSQVVRFFLSTFFIANLFIQVPQAIVSVLFVGVITQIFGEIGFIFYFVGGTYIFYLSFKAFKSRQKKSSLQLNVVNLAMLMLLSPKIWLLFPSGASITNQLTPNLMLNAGIYALTMLSVSSAIFFFHVLVGKVGQKILDDNFSYLVVFLLSGFGVFLFTQGYYAILQ